MIPKDGAWDAIPRCSDHETYNALILDAYLDRELFLVVYDIDRRQLLTHAYPITYTIAFNEDLSTEMDNVTVTQKFNLLTDQTVAVTEVPYGRGIKLLKKSRYKKTKQANTLPEQLRYLHKHGLVPGTRIIIDHGEVKHIKLEDHSKSQMMEDALLGDHPDIINLCTTGMMLFEDIIPKVPAIAFDIEVSSPRGNFPVPEDAMYPIHSIALYDTDGKAYSLILGIYPTAKEIQEIKDILGYDVQIESFIAEKALLRRFLELLQEYRMIVTYNGDGFDLPYIHYRCKRLGIESDIRQSKYFYFRPDIQFGHALHIDLYRFFSNEAVRIYAYGAKYTRSRLTDVSSALLGSEKIGHDLWFDEMNRVEMVTYNVHDARLTMDLLTFSDHLTWKLMIILMRLGKLTLSYVNRATISSWIYNWIVSEHVEKDLYVPTRKELIKKGSFESDAKIDGRKYKGAIVFPAESGIYWNVSVVDYNSLYPSTIKNFNLSYETIRCPHESCKDNTVPELDHWVCTRRLGIMAAMVGYVREIRVRYYKQLTKHEDPLIRTLAKTITAALKVFINAGYGVFGAPKFQLYCPPIAESTTAFARKMLISAKDKAEEMGLEILYGDTDSIFIQDITHEQLSVLRSWSIIEAGIELNVDYVFRFLVMSGRKKNYFGVTQDNKMIIKGLSIKKSNTASFVKHTFEDIAEIFKQVTTPEELEQAQQAMIDIIKSRLRTLKRGEISLDELSHQVTLSKSFDEITSKTPAVQVALQKQLADDSSEIAKGEQYRVVRVKAFEFVNTSTLFPYIKLGPLKCAYMAVETASEPSIDYDYYIEAMKRAFTPIFDAFDLDYDEALHDNTKLTDFFTEAVT